MNHRKWKFIITDVFAESRYAGNQLATFLDASSLSDQEMQQIAREINFSETTFICSGPMENGGYRVRIFTPAAEVNFAGHPTLGTAFVIREHLMKIPAKSVLLNLNVGPVSVEWRSLRGGKEMPVMRQIEPVFREQVETEVMAATLGLNPEELDARWPIQSVSTGLSCYIVPLKNRDSLKKVSIQMTHYRKLTDDSDTKVILTFCPGGYEENQALGVRVFPIAFGIPEDPATGSGNGCLAAYLVRYRVLGSDTVDIQAGQGYEIGRPSVLNLISSREGENIRVEVGGQVQPVAEGIWY